LQSVAEILNEFNDSLTVKRSKAAFISKTPRTTEME
jgi:hypothetical protein